MKAIRAVTTLGFVVRALGHGYVYRITADNTIYPGWDVRIDNTLLPAPDRIAYGGNAGNLGPVTDTTSPSMACNQAHSPPPGAIAEVRAGSNITFHWSHWLYSHKGPITAWMAPYEGKIADVDVNKLEFVKFAEDTVDANGIWSNVRMMDNTNGSWTATIPADIKPGNYVVRQEIIALHFAVSTPPGFGMFQIGPQFYMTCFNFRVTGNGSATPKGVTFPGAYDISEPGLHYDLKSNKPYTPVGPPVYKSKYNVELKPKETVIISPTGNATADAAYYKRQEQVLADQQATTMFFDSIGG